MKREDKDKRKREKEDWENIFKSICDPTLILAPDHTILDLNPTALKAQRMTKEDAVGEKCYKLIHGTEEPPKNCPMEKLLQSERAETERMELEISGGTYLVTVSPVLDKDGNVEKIVHYAKDVSEIKELQKALTEREKNYRTVFENTGTATVIIEEDATLSLVNKQFEDLSGYTREDIEGKMKWYDFVAKDDLVRMKRYHTDRRKNAGSAPNQYEFTFVDRHENVKHILLSVEMIKGTTKSVASLLDITERKRAEMELNQSRETAERYLNIAAEIILALNTKGDITILNDSGHRLLGYKKGELIGKNWFDTCLPDTVRKDVREVFKKLMCGKGRNVGTYENPVITKSGDERIILWHNKVLRNGDGAITGTLSSGEDITERKEAEERIDHLNRVLEAIRNVNQLIVREKDRDRLIARACNQLVGTRGYNGAWLGLFEENRLVTFASAGKHTDFAPLKKMLERGELNECSGRAIDQSGVVTIKDIQTECGGCPLKGKEPEGRALTVRLECDGTVYGILSVSAPEHLATDKDEQGLFREVADDIAYALHGIKLDRVRTQAEEALRQSEDRLSKIMIAANDGMWDWDLTTDDVYFDPRYYRMAGYEVDEFPHRFEEFQKRVHPDDIDGVLNQARKHLNGDTDRFIVEFRFKKKTGSWLWILGRGVIVERDENGAPTRFVGTHTDITDRKQAQQALEQSYAETKKREGDFGALLFGARATLEHDDFASAARAIFDACKGVIGAQSGYVALLSEDGSENEVLFLDAGGLPCDVDPELPMPIRGLRSKAYRTGKPVYDNAFSESSWMKYMPEGHVTLNNVLFAPLLHEGKAVGLIGIANKPEDFTDDDAQLTAAFADIAAVALLKSWSAEALRESEIFLHNVFDAIQNGISVLDKDLTILKTNRWMERMYANQMPHTGKKCYEVYQLRTSPCPWCPSLKTLQTGEVHAEIVPYPSEKNPAGWIELTAFPLKEKDGNTTRVIEYVKDITERRKAEEKLQENEERLRILFSSLNEGILTLDLKGTVTDANPGVERIFGYTKDELVGKGVVKLASLLKIDSREVLATFKKFIVGKAGKTEWDTIRKDGTPISISVLPSILTEGTKKKGISVLVTDITNQKKTERALAESEEKYRMLAESSPVGIFIIQDGDVIYLNSAAERMLASEKIGHEILATWKEAGKFPVLSFINLFDEKQRTKLAEELAKRMAGGDPGASELVTPGNEHYLFIASLITYNGRPAALGITQNISQLRRTEEYLRQSLQEKDVLLREIHHRVKNNMQIISSMLNIQAEHAASSDTKDIFRDSQARIRSMSLIHEKLYRSNDLAWVDFSDYLRSLTIHLSHMYSVSSGAIRIEIDADEDIGIGIDTAIPCGLIVNELISNALHHGFPGDRTGTVTVRFHRTDENNAYVLTVNDDGVGFPEELDFRNTTSLGMKLVCTLVNQLNGTITLDREGGTTFTITFEGVPYKRRM
jgi:PAS domain S-box-containing protein